VQLGVLILGSLPTFMVGTY